MLEPVTKLAERRGVTVLGIMHVGKASDRQARHRALGSVAFVNAARLVFAIGADPDDPGRRLLVPVKANLCREAPALAFGLEDADGVARVVWDAAPVGDVNPDTVLNGHRPPTPEAEDRLDADALLTTLLEDESWPMAARDIEAAAKAHGLHVRSLQRAARKRGVRIEKATFRGGWTWYPPKTTPDSTVDPSTKTTPGPDVSSSAPTSQDDAKTTKTSYTDPLSSSATVSSSEPPKTTVSSSSSSSKHTQNTPIREDDSTMSSPAREADTADADGDPLPAWVTDHDGSAPQPGSSDDTFAARDAEDVAADTAHSDTEVPRVRI